MTKIKEHINQNMEAAFENGYEEILFTQPAEWIFNNMLETGDEELEKEVDTIDKYDEAINAIIEWKRTRRH